MPKRPGEPEKPDTFVEVFDKDDYPGPITIDPATLYGIMQTLCENREQVKIALDTVQDKSLADPDGLGKEAHRYCHTFCHDRKKHENEVGQGLPDACHSCPLSPFTLSDEEQQILENDSGSGDKPPQDPNRMAVNDVEEVKI